MPVARLPITPRLRNSLCLRQPAGRTLTTWTAPLLRTPLRPRLQASIANPTSQRQIGTKAKRSPTAQKFRNAIVSTSIVGGIIAGYVLGTDTRSAIHQYVVPPLLRLVFPDTSAEAAHTVGVTALSRLHSLGIPLHDRSFATPTADPNAPPAPANPFGIAIELFGHPIASPLMIPAGLDKHGDAIDALYAISPAVGLVEIGCVTPKPQPGNPGTRVWRLPGSEGMLNRYGFNSVGSEAVARKLRNRVRQYAKKAGVSEQDVLDGLYPENTTPLPASLIPGRLFAVQIGKNASTPATDLEAVVRDYKSCVEVLGPYADVIVVNVSSPNTPGLRTLQAREPLTRILSEVVDAANKVGRRIKPKVVVKVSPDEDTDAQVADIVHAIGKAGVSGVIVGNTTSRKSDVKKYLDTFPEGRIKIAERKFAEEELGGVSGPVLYPRMLTLVERYRNELDREGSGRGDRGVVVLASGGIRDGKGAIEAMKRGAGGAFIYTGMVYGGVGTIGRVAREMAQIV
ncbi:dihydroorotate dehydrogenase, partial [Peziza echinospora]